VSMSAMQLAALNVLERVEVPAPEPDDVKAGQVLLRVWPAAGAVATYRISGACVAVAGRLCTGRRQGSPGIPCTRPSGRCRRRGTRTGRLGSRWWVGQPGTTAWPSWSSSSGGSVTPMASGEWAGEAIVLQPLTCVLHTGDRDGVAGGRAAVVGVGPVDRDAAAPPIRFRFAHPSTRDRWATKPHVRP
jgi:hypothetical protein